MLNQNLKNFENISISKEKIKRPMSTKENISKFVKNKKNNISNILAQYENSQRKSTRIYTLHNDFKTEYDTAFTLPSFDFVNNTKEKTLITNYKPTKLILRNKDIYRSKTLSNKNKTETNLYYNSKNKKILKKNGTNINGGAKKFNKNWEYKGVPMKFMEAMRLDINNNIKKANQFIKDEKKRVIKNNPNLKYYFSCKNKKNREKDEDLKRAYEYNMKKKILNKNKKNIDDYNLNDYYTKLLLKENEQHFNINRPMIEKNKFSKKFMILKYEIEEKKNYPNIDIKTIFSKLLYDKVFINNEKTVIQLTKELIYKKFRLAIKKSAIEFKNMKIPFNEYVEYYTKSKNIEQILFNTEYSYLTNLIKKEEKDTEDESKKDNMVSQYLDKNKFGIYIIDFFGKSVLILATRKKLYKTMSKIIKYGGNVNVQDFKGRTALHFAVMNNDLIAVVILLYYLANPLITDNNGNKPLNYINKNSDYYMIKEILVRSGIIRKINKYRSWKDFDVCIRRGIQFYLFRAVLKDKYELIFDYIENPVLYYK